MRASAPIRPLLLLACALALAFASPPKITEAQKIAIMQNLMAEVGIARMPLPLGKHGVELGTNGQVINSSTVDADRMEKGDAARVGERVAITGIEFKDDRVVVALNGGPAKGHWYDHVQVGLGGGGGVVDPGPNHTPQGTQVTVKFDSGVPPLTPAAMRQLLTPAIDWDPPSKAKEMVKALPPSVRAAIEAHRALVGMDSDMVLAALGRPQQHFRENDAAGQAYDDWAYNLPPAADDPITPKPTAPAIFVRFINDRVSQVTTFGANGQKLVDTTPDPALAKMEAAASTAAAAAAAASPEAGPEERPTLRRSSDGPPENAPGAPGAGLPPAPQMPAPILLPGGGGVPGASPDGTCCGG